MSFLTVFKRIDGKHAGKTYRAAGSSESPQIAKYFKAEEFSINSFHSMQNVIGRLLTDPECSGHYVVRGQLTEQAKATLSKGGAIRRLLRQSKDGDQPTLIDAPSNVICVDSDELGYPEGYTPKAAVKWLVQQLPTPFQTASYVYQYSSSAFLKKTQGKTKLKVHLWFHVKEAITTEQLREWMNHQVEIGQVAKEVFDPAVFRAAQPLYTAPPKLIGVKDPLSSFQFQDDSRADCVRDTMDSVELPIDAYADPKESKKRKRRKHKSQAIPTTPPEYFGDESGYADDDCRRRIESSIERYQRAADNRYQLTFNTAYYVGGFVAAHRLNIKLAEHLMIEAARLNGTLDKHGEEKIREQIIRGLQNGSTRPIYKSDNKAPHQRAFKTQDEPVNDDVEPSTESEINTATYKAVSDGINGADSSKITIVKVPTGAGKSYQALKVLAGLNAEGKTVVFTSPTYKAVNESIARLSSLSPSIEPLILKGQKQKCQSYVDSSGALRETLDEILEDRRVTDLCHSVNGGRRCLFFDTCEARQEAESHPLEGRFIMAVHQMLGHIKDLPEDAVVVIDESPNYVEKMSVALATLKALVPSRRELNKWRSFTPQQGETGREEVTDLFGNTTTTQAPPPTVKICSFNTTNEEWRHTHQGTISPFVSSLLDALPKVKTDDPLNAVRLNKDIIQQAISPHEWSTLVRMATTAAKALDEGATPKLINVGQVFKQQGLEIESHPHELVKRSAVNISKQLCEVILGDAELWLGTNEKGQPAISKRYDLKLPAAPIVVLDATAQVESWRRISRREIVVHEADIQPLIRQGYHIKYRALQSPQLWADGNKTKVGVDSMYRLSRVAQHLETALSKVATGSAIGIGCSKPFRILLEQGLSNEGQLANTPLIKLFKRYDCHIGHTGNDHAYTNRFSEAGVKAMIILGGQYPHYGEERADCEHLGASDEQTKLMLKERAESNMIQWHGRPRSLRRTNEQIIHIEISPSATPVSWIKWAAMEIRGQAKSDALKHAIEEATSIISAKGQITAKDLTERNIHINHAHRAIKNVAHVFGLSSVPDPTHQGRGRAPLIFYSKKSYIKQEVNIFSESISDTNLSLCDQRGSITRGKDQSKQEDNNVSETIKVTPVKQRENIYIIYKDSENMLTSENVSTFSTFSKAARLDSSESPCSRGAKSAPFEEAML